MWILRSRHLKFDFKMLLNLSFVHPSLFKDLYVSFLIQSVRYSTCFFFVCVRFFITGNQTLVTHTNLDRENHL